VDLNLDFSDGRLSIKTDFKPNEDILELDTTREDFLIRKATDLTVSQLVAETIGGSYVSNDEETSILVTIPAQPIVGQEMSKALVLLLYDRTSWQQSVCARF
jgi:hypothetical protein